MGKWRFLLVKALLGVAFMSIVSASASSEGVSDRLKQLVATFLESQGADAKSVCLVETTGISYTVGDKICINSSRNKLGPVEFVLAHEVGHILAGHCEISGEPEEETRAMEKEADLLAAEILHSLGLDRAIFERIGDLKLYGADCAWEDTNHPPLLENARYLSDFLIRVGYTQESINQFCEKYIPARNNELRGFYEECE
jgi:hypothetical protein